MPSYRLYKKWDIHIHFVWKQISYSVFVLRCLFKSASKEALTFGYHGLTESRLRYCVISWLFPDFPTKERFACGLLGDWYLKRTVQRCFHTIHTLTNLFFILLFSSWKYSYSSSWTLYSHEEWRSSSTQMFEVQGFWTSSARLQIFIIILKSQFSFLVQNC